MQLFMALAIVLSSETLAASRPMTLERFLFVVGPDVTCTRSVNSYTLGKPKVKNIPFKLKLRVNVLPQPGTGHTKVASCFLLLCEAFAVRPVVTFGFETTTGTCTPDGIEGAMTPFTVATPTMGVFIPGKPELS